jgi:hypothetical protein
LAYSINRSFIDAGSGDMAEGAEKNPVAKEKTSWNNE